MENSAPHVGQIAYLKSLLSDQARIGRLTKVDLGSIDYYAVTGAEYRKMLALLYNNKYTELEGMLFSLGGKGK